MSLKDVFDAGGSKLRLLEFNGRRYPAFDVETVTGVSRFQARSDDVAVCAFPKSGTHWIWEMVRILLAGTTELPVEEKDVGFIEFNAESAIAAQPSPRSINTHMSFDNLPPQFLSKKVKVIYVTRDPRDITASYYNHHRKIEVYQGYDGQWKDYLPLFLNGELDYGSWFEYTKGWERGMAENPKHPFLVTSFEAMHQNTIKELKRIGQFIEVDRDDEFLEKVVSKCNLATMRKAKGHFDVNHRTGSPVMYRKGKVGDWKNWFTVAQLEEFNEMFEREMPGTQAYTLYSHSYKPDVIGNGNASHS